MFLGDPEVCTLPGDLTQGFPHGTSMVVLYTGISDGGNTGNTGFAGFTSEDADENGHFLHSTGCPTTLDTL